MLSLDTGALGSALIVTLVAIVTYYLSRQYFPEWEAKDEDGEERFVRLAGRWPLLFQVSGAVGAFAAFFSYIRFDGGGVALQSYASLAIGIITFFLTFMGWTDLYTMKAPREMAYICLAFIIPLGLAGLVLGDSALPKRQFLMLFYNNPYLDHWVQFLVFLFLVALIWLFVPNNQLGGGDVKALWVVAFGIEPLVGFFPAIYFLGFAAVIQVLLIFILAPLMNWGKIVHDPMKKTRTSVNRLWSRISKSERELIPAYNSRATPLLPAIGAGYVVGALVFTGFAIVF